MPKHRGDLRQRRAPAQHAGGHGVTQPMRRHPRQPGAVGCSSHDGPHRRRAQRRIGGADLQEQAGLVAAGAAPLQVASQRRPDIGGQRQLLLAIGLAPYQDLSRAPIHVREPQRGHLTRPQPEAGQQYQDCEVTPPRTGASVAGGKQPANLLRGDRPRQRRATPAGHVRYRPRQVAGRVTLQVDEPQQCPQRRHQQPRPPR